MTITKITLRFIFSTVIVLCLIYVLSHISKNYENQNYAFYILFLTVVYVYLPAILLLIILSIYNYLSRGVLWSLFKIEYYFLIASLSLFVLDSVIEALCYNCNL